MNNRLLDALRCQNKGRPPVWLMRQAGRYMPQYRALREKHSFLDICFNHELIVQTTLLPIELLHVDAAIIFSDILLLAKPLGFNLVFDEGIGPLLTPVLRNKEAIPVVSHSAILETLLPLSQAIQTLRSILEVPLIGFSAAPFTLASYLIEGKTNRDLRFTKQWMVSNAESFHLLLNRLTDATITLLKMQIEAGVQAVQIFDSWAMNLSPEHFKTFAIPYLRKIKEAMPPQIPVICFCRGGNAAFLHDIQPHAISIDWTINLPEFRSKTPTGIAIQGNLDPCWLYAPIDALKKEASKLIDAMQNDPGYIFNLGHGIPQDVSLSTIQKIVEHVGQMN